MKMFLVRKWSGDSYGHGDYHFLGICFTEASAEAIVKEFGGEVVEVPVIDVGAINPAMIEL